MEAAIARYHDEEIEFIKHKLASKVRMDMWLENHWMTFIVRRRREVPEGKRPVQYQRYMALTDDLDFLQLLYRHLRLYSMDGIM